MKNRKYTLFSFSGDVYKGVEQYLNDQAARGWELERVGSYFARFRATDRTDLKYSVDLVSGKKEEQAEYLELCREAGWDQVGRRGRMAIFASQPGRNPVPVQTDPQLERSNYRRIYRRELTWVLIVVLVWGLFYAWLMRLAGVGEGNFAQAAQTLRYGWVRSWQVVLFDIAVVLLAVCLVPSMASCLRAWIGNRRAGKIVAPPRWALWADGVSTMMWVLIILIVLAANVAGSAETGRTSAPVQLAVLGGACLIFPMAASAREEEKITPGRRRVCVQIGVLFLALAGVAAVAIRMNPNSSVTFFSGNDDFESYYQEAVALDLVTGEDLGLDLGENWGTYEDEELGTVDLGVVRHYTLKQGIGPAGRYTILMSDLNYELEGFSCTRYDCRSGWLAERAADALTAQAEASVTRSYYNTEQFGGADMAPTALDWADAAWYGERHGENGGLISVLVLRRGEQVVRLSAPMPLMTDEALAVIQNRLGM